MWYIYYDGTGGELNAYSEISAMVTAFLVAFILFKFTPIKFPISLLYSVPSTLVVWLIVTFLTPSVEKEKLIHFYKKSSSWWSWMEKDEF